MKILIRKPTGKEVAEMQTKPVWECEVSEFE